jgi:hypothetical protein
LTASRRAIGQNREVVCVNHTPAGEIICVYLEGRDPAAANRAFAASKSAYDTWFKVECRKIFMDGIDFDQPVPPIEQIWDWQAALSATAPGKPDLAPRLARGCPLPSSRSGLTQHPCNTRRKIRAPICRALFTRVAERS